MVREQVVVLVVVVVCEGRVERAGEAGTCLTACISKGRVAQWQCVGPITQRSVARAQALLPMLCDAACTEVHASFDGDTMSPPHPKHPPFIPLDNRSYWYDACVCEARGSGQLRAWVVVVSEKVVVAWWWWCVKGGLSGLERLAHAWRHASVSGEWCSGSVLGP